MKIELQNNDELTQLSKLIADISVCMLTSIDANGALVSKPMSPLEMDSSGAIWFFVDLGTDDIEQPYITNLSFTDASNGTYVSISGYRAINKDHAHIADLWTLFANPWFPDGPESTNLALLKFVPHAAEYWDAPNSKMVRFFAMAASVIAGKPMGLGEHATLVDLVAAPEEMATANVNTCEK